MKLDFDSKYSEDLEVAQKAAKRAGRLLDRYRREGIDIHNTKKTDTDLVTEADLEAQKKIVEVIRDEFPADAIRAEEEDLDEKHSDRVWVIDPIDGTTNFFHGLDYFCVSIGLKIGEETISGIVHSPTTGLGKTFIGLKDEGAYVLEEVDSEEGEHIQASRKDMHGSLFSCYYRDGEPEKRERQKTVIEELVSRGMVNRAAGACALDLCSIAAGKTEVFADYASEWDYAGGKAILEEAGGKLEVIDDKMDQEFVLASNGRFHDELLEILRDTLERF